MKRRAAISYQRSVVSGTASGVRLKAESRSRAKGETCPANLTASNGFSLVEVTLTLAIISIAFIAILGLIPQGVQSGRNAADNTLVATIVHDTFNDMRRQALVLPWPPTPSDIYYDAAGTNQVILTSPDRYYRIRVTSQPSPSMPNLQIITAEATWRPYSTNYFVTQIARYQ